MQKIKKLLSLFLVVVLVAISSPMTAFAAHPFALTGGGDNILDPGETLSGTEEWGDSAVYAVGSLQYTVDASASVAGEDITFTYTPIGGSVTWNNSNVLFEVVNDSNSDSCSENYFITGAKTPVTCVIQNATGGGTYTIDINHNNGSPCDHVVPSDQPTCDAADFTASMDATATIGTTVYNGQQQIIFAPVTTGEWLYYKIVIANATNDELSGSTVHLSGPFPENPDVTLCHSVNTVPTNPNDGANCSITANDNGESIDVASTSVDDHYFGLYAVDTFDLVQFAALYVNEVLSGTSVSRTGLETTGNEEYQYYTIDIPAGATDLVFHTDDPADGTNGDLALYARFADYPHENESVYDNKADNDDNGDPNDETITIASPTAGIWYVGFSDANSSTFSNVTLEVSYTAAGGAVPEFHEWVLIFTVLIAIGLMWKFLPKLKTPQATA